MLSRLHLRAIRAFGPAAAYIVGIFLLSVMDAIIKHVGGNHGTAQVTFMRYFAGSICAVLVFAALRTQLPSLSTIRPHLWRSVVVVATALSFFYALANLPLAVALALSFTSPIFIALFAGVILGERPGRAVYAALALGFAGVLVVLWSQMAGAEGTANLAGIGAALFSAVSYALSMVVLKSRAARDPLPTIVLFQNLFPSLIIAPMAATAWTPMVGGELALMLTIGALGTAGHLCLASAYKRADASRLGVFEYTAFIWAIGIGYFAFAEVPSAGTLAGAALIIGGALLASRRNPVPTPEPDVEIGP